MKHTYTKRTPILTLVTFFALVLGGQWTFGQQPSIDSVTFISTPCNSDTDNPAKAKIVFNNLVIGTEYTISNDINSHVTVFSANATDETINTELYFNEGNDITLTVATNSGTVVYGPETIPDCKSLEWNYNNYDWDDITNWKLNGEASDRYPGEGGIEDDVKVSPSKNVQVPKITVDANVRDVTYDKKLRIDAGGSLTCRNLTLNNAYNELVTNTNKSSTKFGSLIVEGEGTNEGITFSSNAANLAFIRYIADYNGNDDNPGFNDLISSPFNNEKFYDFSTGDVTKANFIGLAKYNNSSTSPNAAGKYSKCNVSENSPEKFTHGKGFVIGKDHDTALPEGSDQASGNRKKIRFNLNDTVESGTNDVYNNIASNLNNTTVSLLKDTTSNNPWNLVGNPYLSYYKLDQFIADNTDALDPNYLAVYGYDKGNFVAYTVDENGAYDRDIAPGSGFFVAAINNGANLVFKPTNRTTHSNKGEDDFNSGRNTNDGNGASFKLTISNSETQHSTKFNFNNNMTNGLNPGYDVGSYNAKSKTTSIYSLLVDQSSQIDFEIQALPLNKINNLNITIGVNAIAGIQNTISIGENSLNNQDVILIDNYTNQSHNLTKGDFTFVPNQDLNGSDRFSIVFESEALNTSTNTLKTLKVATKNKQINILGALKENTSLRIYDMQGRMVYKDIITSANRKITLGNANGIYVVCLSNSEGQKTQKVILK